jgi:DNA-binding FrmR family transcriptional regulator
MEHHESANREEVAKRLARIAGHATSLKRLWEEGRSCDDMLTQIAAVRAALDATGKVILEHHIEHCVREAITRGDGDSVVRDLKKSLGRLS